MFCPLCHDVYNLPDEFEFLENTDGAYFGKSFPSIFMLNFPQFCDDCSYIYPRGLHIYKQKMETTPPEYKIAEENQPNDYSNDKNFVEISFNRRSVLLTKSFNQS